MRVVFTSKIEPSLKEDLERSFPELHLHYHETPESAKADLKKADILFTYGGGLKGGVLEEAQNLQWMMVASAGLDDLPMDWIQKQDLLVTNARGVHQIQMSEFTLHAMLDHARSALSFRKNQDRNIWEKLQVHELYGKSVGILGAGAIGTEIARKSHAFGMEVWGMNSDGRNVENFDYMVSKENLDELLSASDYVINVLPSTPQTDNLIDRSFLDTMKNEGVLINIGRGNTVKEKDLQAALEQGEISHAYLDVFKEEPLPDHHPFWSMEEITITPHVAGDSPYYQARVMPIFKHNLQVFLSGKGQYQNVVDISEGY
ncbi:phosphoglycerate dehydrogenase-like enzyme [Geomicrobium halophilum]|uniref:Phosphoglycerate dehydrogenase-like enzyme n=1 Tax=Geomicrobium halophilum TaxID=549000 RepID=A0A841Q0C7_9BACL|nr:D-2-hydroxyacid dehydrogenase [Geomicrobium halophilum]MBB6450625.1 phosphoglycerate dehydrogenase-like enzyme [Geomicrobium halophilum]